MAFVRTKIAVGMVTVRNGSSSTKAIPRKSVARNHIMVVWNAKNKKALAIQYAKIPNGKKRRIRNFDFSGRLNSTYVLSSDVSSNRKIRLPAKGGLSIKITSGGTSLILLNLGLLAMALKVIFLGALTSQ